MTNYKWKKVSLLAYLFSFLFTGSIYPQALNTDQQETYKEIINLTFDGFPSLNQDELSATDAYLLHTHYAIQFLLTESPHYLSLLENQSDKFIKNIESSASSPWQGFYLAELKLQTAFINLKKGNELNAAWQIRQAYKTIIKNHELYPEFRLNYKTMGLLHVMIGAIPEQYHWIVGLMGMEGDIKQGLKELDVIAKASSIYQLESKILQQVVRSYLLDQTEKAANLAIQIADQNQDNVLITYITAALLLKNNEAKKAEKLIMTSEKDKLPLLHYQAGEVYLQLGNYSKAQTELERFISLYQGNNFKKDAYYKLFLSAWLDNDEQQAKVYFDKARLAGQTLTEADKHAAKMLENDNFPNRTIMKVRLFTDGGEYEKAKSLISKTSHEHFNRPQDALEFLYRKARLYHKNGEIAEAISLYESVIMQQKEDHYFAPNSCLQLGYIFSDQGDTLRARDYFDKALSYRNHEYKNSIDNKAKAALKLLD